MSEGTLEQVLSGEATWTVVHGDCLDVMATMPDKSIAHVITDPPFEVEAHTKQRRSLKDATQKRGAKNTGEVRRTDAVLPFAAITANQRALIGAAVARLVKRWGIVFCQIEAVAAWREALSGCEWVRGGVWRKPDGMPQFTGDRPGQGFESLAIVHPSGRKRWNGGGKHAVWTVPLEHGHGNGIRNEHPTQKPVALMLELVDDFTDPGELILDPFAGSGSTGVAAVNRGRRFIGIERDETFCNLARERIRAAASGSTLQARRAGQVPLFGVGT